MTYLTPLHNNLTSSLCLSHFSKIQSIIVDFMHTYTRTHARNHLTIKQTRFKNRTDVSHLIVRRLHSDAGGLGTAWINTVTTLVKLHTHPKVLDQLHKTANTHRHTHRARWQRPALFTSTHTGQWSPGDFYCSIGGYSDTRGCNGSHCSTLSRQLYLLPVLPCVLSTASSVGGDITDDSSFVKQRPTLPCTGISLLNIQRDEGESKFQPS